MRKFLVEMDSVVTLDEIKNEYDARRAEAEADGIENFAQFLDACMFWNNGALTEILTEDTPRGAEMRAVSLVRVQYSEDEDDVCEEWLTPSEICEKWRDGCGVKYID